MPTGKSETGVTARLQVLARDRSQSEIARLTGTSVANVNRYLRGRRVPAEFCSALVSSLGVNPNWLLTGEGSPYAADVAAGTARIAGNVLELVEAMNGVAQMRLGALAGKHHARVLRELNDALLRHEALRQRLNVQSAPIFRRLLDELEEVLGRYNVERATDLCKACEQVERLCDEPELSRRLVRLRAHFEFVLQNPTRAVMLHQKLVRDRIADAELAIESDCELFYRLAVTLGETGRNADALRVCDSFRALAGDTFAGWELYDQFEFFRGSLLVELGSLYPGLALMQRHFPGTRGNRREVSRRMQMRAQLYAGLMTLDEAFHYGQNIPAKAMYLLEIAAWQQERDPLKKMLGYASKHMSLQLRRDDGVRFAEAMELSLDRKDGLKSYLAGGADFAKEPAHRPLQQIRACTLALLERRKRAAQKHHQVAKELLGEEAQHRVGHRALHHRNALRLGLAGDDRTRAEAFFKQLAEAGYIFAP